PGLAPRALRLRALLPVTSRPCVRHDGASGSAQNSQSGPFSRLLVLTVPSLQDDAVFNPALPSRGQGASRSRHPLGLAVDRQHVLTRREAVPIRVQLHGDGPVASQSIDRECHLTLVPVDCDGKVDTFLADPYSVEAGGLPSRREARRKGDALLVRRRLKAKEMTDARHRYSIARPRLDKAPVVGRHLAGGSWEAQEAGRCDLPDVTER